MSTEQVAVNQVGFLCNARKLAVVRNPQSPTFEVQNMAFNLPAAMGGEETFKAIYSAPVEIKQTALGTYGVCDFSAVTQPGIYRVALPENKSYSYQFMISDGAFSRLPFLFLDFIHELRSGFFTSDLHAPLHLDDGVRSDTGERWDAVGGWYDAGDLRKWMGHSTLPALAFMDIQDRLTLPRHHFNDQPAYDSDWLTEAVWGLRLIFKMQDPETGMIFEDVGGGSTARKTDEMTWWYENHAGCYADNADNRFTDNLRGTGDERTVRVHFNAIAQYTNIAITARAYALYSQFDAQVAADCYNFNERCWGFCETKRADESHYWTSVRAWRLCAALERYRVGLSPLSDVDDALNSLLENFDEDLGFWTQRAERDDPYRGIIHAAQPIIALAKYLDFVDGQSERVIAILNACKTRYILPLTDTNPYHFMPYGTYRTPPTEDELYRPLRDNLTFRFVMPVNHFQKINHGLAGHWMSWAHALAYAGRMLNDSDLTDLAWSQIDWLLGNNDVDVSMVTGVGYVNPMPHSRFLGTIIGGFCNAFRGTADDIPTIDMERKAEWNSTEYWNVPLSNCLMALSWLLPAKVNPSAKIGA